MANSDKDILITPNKGTTSLPELSFIGQVNSPIKLRVLDDNTLSFEGSAGQLFSINNNLTTGTIFAVSDVSGVPSLSVNADGTVAAAPYNGYLTVGIGNFTTDRQLAVRGSIMVANRGSTSARLEFQEIAASGGNLTGTAGAMIYYDGPNFSDNNNYLSIATAGTDRLTVTYGGGVGINTNNPRTRFHIFGTHNDTSWRLTLPAGVNGGGNGDTNMQAWVSEPGVSWDNGGLGMNVTNYRVATYPTATDDASLSYFPRLNTNIGQSYIRFLPNGGRLFFTTTDNNGTAYQNSIQMGSGCLSVGALNTTYKFNVTGDINFTGNLYQAGAIFKTLPTQTATTDGSVLRSRYNPTASAYEAYWTHDLDSNYRLENPDQWAFRYIINRGYTVAGYQNANPWRNGNRTVHASDVTISIGDVIDYSGAYIGGSHNGVNLFVYNCSNSWLPAASTTCSMSMITETNRGLNSSWNDTRARSYSGAWIDFMGNQWRTNAGRNMAYNTSGNGNTSRHNLNTEVMISEIGGSITYVSHAEGEYFAWVSQGQNRFEFSTETYTAWSNYSPAPGCDGINKHQATRIGFFYASQGGNTDRAVTKRRDSDAVIIRSGILKPESGGEENLHTGMNKGYCISNYNYAQNNNAWIYQYYNDVIRFADSTLTYRKGIPGASSGTGQEGGDAMGAGVPERSYMIYAGGQQAAPGTVVYGGSTGITLQGGAPLTDGSGATGGIGTY